jgi:hypothetical protein
LKKPSQKRPGGEARGVGRVQTPVLPKKKKKKDGLRGGKYFAKSYIFSYSFNPFSFHYKTAYWYGKRDTDCSIMIVRSSYSRNDGFVKDNNKFICNKR